MRIFTYATHTTKRLEMLIGMMYVELLPITGEWTNDFYQKAKSFNNTIQELPEDDIVVLLDAFDVLPANGCTKEKLEKALTDNFSMDKVVFNAEKNCFPDSSLKSRYPESETPWRFLNAGALAGKVKVLKQLYASVLEKIPNTMDQLQFSIAFLDGELIELDYECKVFQTLFMESDGDLTYSKDGVKNNITGTYPLIIHGNGMSSVDKVYLQYES